MRTFAKIAVLTGWLLAGATTAWAAGYADQVVRYTSGVAASGDPEAAFYTTASAALGKPAARLDVPGEETWDGNPDQSILTSSNATYAKSALTAVGVGGELVLHLATPAATNGKTIGVHAGVGLALTYPGQRNLIPAMTYTDPRVAVVSVAQTLQNWVDLNNGNPITFNLPTNYFSAGLAGPFTNDLGTEEADFFKPFNGTLSDFSDTDWAGTLSVLDGSAGGYWLDLSGTGLSSVNYIRFAVPAGAADNMYVDAVVSVPEPATFGLLALASVVMLGRRRRA